MELSRFHFQSQLILLALIKRGELYVSREQIAKYYITVCNLQNETIFRHVSS